ncbi:MAG: PBP1A family penicillin-binding protein [Elusimicrobiota bacterium]
MAAKPKPGRRRPKRRPLRLFLLAAAAALIAATALLILGAERKLSQLVVGGLGESFSTRVYSAAFPLDEQTPISPARLLERLERLGYRAGVPPLTAGQYLWQAPVLQLHLRGFAAPLPAQEPGIFQLTQSSEERWTLTGASRITLEPEVAAELSGPKKVRRDPASAEELPRPLKDAVIAAEDKRFLTHRGVDPRAIMRSAWHNAVGSDLHGGSTITQQLVKNLFLTPKRHWRRKLSEAALALYLELRYSKEKILTLYLNHIYFGQEGPVSVAGIKAAARFYFDKPLSELSLPDCALLAGLIRSPHRYNPRRDPAAAKQRRDFVLKRMQDEGMISAEQRQQASAAPLALAAAQKTRKDKNDNAYFLAEVVRQALPRFGEDALFRQGLSLYTTMDPLLQKAAQRALRLSKNQAALVALDPATGRVLALAGGRDYAESQFNRATQASRQPGSAFKPFLYGAALENGFTPASTLEDSKKAYKKGPKTWTPENYDGVYHGTTTVREALAHSMNAASLDLANKLGPKRVIEYARRLGIISPLEPSLALVLGVSEVNLLELTGAYAAFANGGFKVTPRLITSVSDAEGQVLEYTTLERDPVLKPADAFLMTSMLASVIKEGTARSLSALGWTRSSAGKTGTTNDGRDAWFIGYTRELLAGVWVGDDDHRSIKATGAKDAGPVWVSFMQEASAGPDRPFVQPQGLVTVKLDPASGYLARTGCPVKQDEVFVIGSEPVERCPLHVGGLKGWFKRLFGG